jgi:hypothetical protein
MTTTLEIPRIRKTTRTLELNSKEIVLLQDMIFRSKVDTMLELKGYTTRGKNGSDFQREAEQAYQVLLFLETKLDNLTK